MFDRNVTKQSATDTTSCAYSHESSLTLLEGKRMPSSWIWRNIRQWTAPRHRV